MITDLLPYPTMKDSGVESLGEVPQHWNVRRLKADVSNVVDQTRNRGTGEMYVALEHVESWIGSISFGDSAQFCNVPECSGIVVNRKFRAPARRTCDLCESLFIRCFLCWITLDLHQWFGERLISRPHVYYFSRRAVEQDQCHLILLSRAAHGHYALGSSWRGSPNSQKDQWS